VGTPRDFEFHFPITTEDALRHYLRVAWGVTIPDKKICEQHSTPWRAFCDAFFAKAPIVVWEGSRGFSGKSFTMSVLGIAEGTALGADVNVLGGSGEQSRRVLSAMQDRWGFKRAPKTMLVGEASRVTRLVNGAKIQALMASQASVRGPHPQRLRIDEVDECALVILDAALGQAMSKPGGWGADVKSQTLLSSTHQYPDGTMTEVKRRMAEAGFPYHPWCYRETLKTEENPDGWLLPSEVEEKKSVIPASMWETEYELQEPSPESRAIMPDAVKWMFDASMGEYPYTVHETVVEPYHAGAKYATGADWARSIDRTVFVTLRFDCKPMRVVALRTINRREWPDMVRMFEERLHAYGNCVAAHDGTGLGDVIDGYLNVECDKTVLVGRERADVFSEYIAAIERKEIKSPIFALMEQEHRYASVDDLYGRGHPPDTFVAGALAYQAATKLRKAAFAVA